MSFPPPHFWSCRPTITQVPTPLNMHYQEKAVQYFFVRSGRSLLQKGNEKKMWVAVVFFMQMLTFGSISENLIL